MQRFLILAAFCCFCGSACADEFYYRDHGWTLRSRTGAIEQQNGFETGAKGGKATIKATMEDARDSSRRLDNQYNHGVNRLGEAGHGVVYDPCPLPAYLTRTVYVRDPYPVYVRTYPVYVAPVRVIHYTYR